MVSFAIAYVWIISFISVFVATFWISVVAIFRLPKLKRLPDPLPKVTLVIPAWNEENVIVDTLRSVDAMDYPKGRLEVFVINDCSTDNTRGVIEGFLKDKKYSYICLLNNKKNLGKSNSINRALKIASGEYFAVCDADTTFDKDIIREALKCYSDQNIVATTSQVKVYNPRNIIEKMVRVELIFASYMRRMMNLIGTLYYTNGVMSTFRTDILRRVGGFSDKTLTEDLEVGMRLKRLGFDIAICDNRFGYTKVPRTIRSHWRQRIRWFRGYIQTCLLHRKLFGSKAHGLFGLFQLPLELVMLMVMLFSALFMLYQGLKYIYEQFVKILTLGFDYFVGWNLPDLKEWLLGIDIRIWFPLIIGLVVGLYLYHRAHKHMAERWLFIIPSFIYLFLYPIVRSLQWWHAVYLEITGARRRWR